jgi:hypothetical protein
MKENGFNECEILLIPNGFDNITMSGFITHTI